MQFTVRSRNLTVQAAFQRVVDFRESLERSFAESLGQDPKPVETYRHAYDQTGGVTTYSLAAAYQLTDRLSVGLAGVRWLGRWRFSSLASEKPYAQGEEEYFLYRERNRFKAWSFNFGFLLRYRYLNLGASWRKGFRARWSSSPSLDTNIPAALAVQPTSAFLAWPESWTVGIALKPTDTWHIMADWAHYAWSDMIMTLADGTRLNFLDLEPPATTRIRDTDHWRFGSEWTVFAGSTPVFLRAGYAREPIPGLTAEGKRELAKVFSAGVGTRLGRLAVDLSYQWEKSRQSIAAFIDPRVLTERQLRPSAVGTVRRETKRLVLGVVWQFASRQTMTDLLHVLFVGPKAKDQ